MNKDNKLFQSIVQTGSDKAEEITALAEHRANERLAEAEAQAAQEAQAVLQKAKAKAEGIVTAGTSNAALIRRNSILRAKREEIAKTLDSIYEYINSLGDSDYFALLYNMAKKTAGTYDELLLNERDRKRAPSDFTQKMAEAGVKASLSDEFAPINGGFVLRSGAVETNCSLSAVVEDSRSDIEDFINASLFGQEGA
jgi:V/A-type H+-transporting ATPase subunit E